MERISESIYHLDEIKGGPTLLLAPEYLTLVDAGLPDSGPAIFDAIRSLGRDPGEIRNVLITHADTDHVGALPTVVSETGAEVYAGAGEADVVEGRTPGRNGKLRTAVPVTYRLSEEQTLPLHGGIDVVEVFGHTLGHIAFLIREPDVLIAGDSISNRAGLSGSEPEYTADPVQALRAVWKLAALAPESVCFGHGPSLVGDAAPRLRALAESLSDEPTVG